MISNGWVLTVPGVHINAEYPGTVRLEISPGEKALLDKGVISEQELVVAYRASIERGSFTDFTWLK